MPEEEDDSRSSLGLYLHPAPKALGVIQKCNKTIIILCYAQTSSNSSNRRTAKPYVIRFNKDLNVLFVFIIVNNRFIVDYGVIYTSVIAIILYK